MKKGLKDYQPKSEDLNKQCVVCELCTENVYIMDAGTECKSISCDRCVATDVATYREFFKIGKK